ncbi:MAG: MotA/TolQ/ExbB proton channel family protein [Candidatus Competibacterales bacterium]|nr:MotA/TolQ/ExbB proton channel family protein [Candidatus Competibacterales bacterium]
MEPETTTGAGQALEGLAEWLAVGGPVLEILIGLSVVALTVTLLKLYQFACLRVWSDAGVEAALRCWQAHRADEALAILARQHHPVARVLAATMDWLRRPGADEARIREETERIANGWLETLRRYLRVLEVIGSLSPLLGLLGTVLGMIDAFQQVQLAGSRLDPTLLAGGIWEALLTTAAGLTVAIPAVVVLHALEHAVERLGHRLEDAVTRVFTRAVTAPARTAAA